MQIFLSEFIGTALMLLFGGGVVANVLLEKSKGQAKAMVNSWSVETNSVEDTSVLNEVIGTGFYVDNANKNNIITAEQTKEYSWLFSGMKGFKK